MSDQRRKMVVGRIADTGDRKCFYESPTLVYEVSYQIWEAMRGCKVGWYWVALAGTFPTLEAAQASAHSPTLPNDDLRWSEVARGGPFRAHTPDSIGSEYPRTGRLWRCADWLIRERIERQ